MQSLIVVDGMVGCTTTTRVLVIAPLSKPRDMGMCGYAGTFLPAFALCPCIVHSFQGADQIGAPLGYIQDPLTRGPEDIFIGRGV